MKITIHQPEAFPWLGFFHKMYLADVFVLLDTVQFKKNDFQNRNKIFVGGKAGWLTIPVKNHSLDTKIKDIEINWESPIIKKHITTLTQSYGGHPYSKELLDFFKHLYVRQPQKLADFNSEVILFLKEKLGITTKVVRASELPLSGNALGGTEVTLEICKILNAKTYISGAHGKNYLDIKKYDEAGIPVYFQEFIHPVYSQKNTNTFISHLSVIDLYANHGPESLKHIVRNNLESI
jgi:hypothetical protein